MSTDGTKPPSFAPPSAGGTGKASVRTDARPGSGDAPRKDDPAGASKDAPATGDGRADKPTGGSDTTSTRAVPAGLRAPAPASAGSAPADSARASGARPAADRPSARPAPERTSTRPTTERTTVREDAPAPAGPRRVRLAVARVDPWSVMKLSFLLSFAVGIMIVVASVVVWMTLDGMGVFSEVNTTIAEITGDAAIFDLEELVAFDRVVALATIIAVVDVVLLTALATIGAFLYNIVAALVGGIHLTLTDD